MTLQDLLSTLDIPEQTQTKLSFAKATHSGISSWLDDLPRANLGGLSKQIYFSMIEINRCKMPSDERIRILDLIAKEVSRVSSLMHRSYLRGSIFLDKRKENILELAITLHDLIAEGYMIAVSANLLDSTRRPVAAQAIARALDELNNVLMLVYQSYSHTPENLWHRIHTLFAIAESAGLTDKKFATVNTGNSKYSLEQFYLRPILLSSVARNRLRNNEIQMLNEVILEWASWVMISRDERDAVYDINLAKDSEPKQLAVTDSVERDENARFVNTQSLARAILARSNNSQSTAETLKGIRLPRGYSPSLLQHLARSWSSAFTRQYQRLNSTGNSIKVGIGLACCHYWLSGKQYFTDSTGESSLSFDAADTLNASYAEGGLDLTSGSAEPETRRLFSLEDCKVINASPGGYALLWEGRGNELMQVGELVCIQDPRSERFNVATIRWIERDGASIRFGLEIIAPTAEAMTISKVVKNRPSSHLRALLVRGNPNTNRPASIIVSRFPFQENDAVTLTKDEKSEEEMKLENWISGSSVYSQFTFSSNEDAGLGLSSNSILASEPAAHDPFEMQLDSNEESSELSLSPTSQHRKFDDLWDQM